jgi:sugar phosphate isomerase/epimerase
MTGLCSITFRTLSTDRIIALAAAAGLGGIEWGGDVHVPPLEGEAGENPRARAVGDATGAAGLAVLSYGSYYRLGDSQDFAPVLAAACSLGAPLIRIWAGRRGSAAADGDYYRAIAAELDEVCRRAAGEGRGVALEYHRNTLTDTGESADRLLRLTEAENLSVCWQPNPDLPPEEHHREISLLLPRISQVHVFHWLKGSLRRLLSEGTEPWESYVRLLGTGRNFILEFVPEDREDQLAPNAAVLRGILEKAPAGKSIRVV